MAKIIPVLLSGGAGSRLWPASDRGTPKPFLELFGRVSTFAETLHRIDTPAFEAPIIVSRFEHRYRVVSALAEAGLTGTILLEPVPRGTTAAIAAAAEWTIRRDPEAVLLVLAADHLIDDVAQFRSAVETAAAAAERGRIVVFGMTPTRPETGYGYVRKGGLIRGLPGVATVRAFLEKPDVATASALIADGCLWNSGNFVLAASVAAAEIAKRAPATGEAARRAIEASVVEESTVILAREPFAEADPISFDHAVMEKTDRAAVVEGDFSWRDVGTWASIWDAAPHDENGNAVDGEVAVLHSTGSIVYTDGPVVGVVGVDNMIVVAANNGVVVAPRAQADTLRDLAAPISKFDQRLVGGHARHYRPWGYYQTLDDGPTHQVKRLLINPGGVLSLQKHQRRAEHWTVVAGTAEVTIAYEKRLLSANETAFVPMRALHRIANPGTGPAIVIEVQCGDYLGEDDIERLEDVYGRV